MTTTPSDIDVLIVGAGPVGLFLAHECRRHGMRCRLVETRASQSQYSKALAVMPRTMEIFDMAGVAASFAEAANPVTGIAIVDPSRTLARMRFAPEESPYPCVAMVPQDVTERLLLDALRSAGGDVEYETSFVSAVQDDEGVSVTLDKGGGRQETRAAYVVGCDGAHSAVRHLLGLSFEGQTYDAHFMLADVETNDRMPASEMQLCPSALGPLAIFPMSATRRRVVATVAAPEAVPPSLDTVRRVLVERGPSELEARGINWSSYFQVHHRRVTQLRVGRIFLAGDAAHIHSPIGGQGMNTGLHDVWNLVWKLDLAVRGKASAALIDSYDAERMPVIRSVIELTHRMTRGLGTPSRSAQVVRDVAIPLLLRIPPFRHAMVERLSQLGVSYAGSPIVEGKGERYFDETLGGGASICRKFLLVLGDRAGDSALDAARHLCAERADIVEVRRGGRHGVTLVRPDGYVGFEATSADGSAFSDMNALLHTMIA